MFIGYPDQPQTCSIELELHSITVTNETGLSFFWLKNKMAFLFSISMIQPL